MRGTEAREGDAMPMTITEALAEIKTIAKRVQKKREFLQSNVARPSMLLDPLLKEGGSEKRFAEELQALGDLLQRTETIRIEIQRANQKNALTVEGRSKTVAGWLAWRKECAPIEKALVTELLAQTRALRQHVEKQTPADKRGDASYSVAVHTSEDALHRRAEELEKIIGDLDGRLSLFNATTTIDV